MNTKTNPYTSPQPANTAPQPSILLWMLGCVFGTGFLGGVIGTLLGLALGTYAPGYYRSVFATAAA